MIPVFIEYLTIAKRLPLQGIGELYVERIAAQIDISGRQVIPPATLLNFRASSTAGGKEEWIQWAANKLGTDSQQIDLQYAEFIKNWLSTLQHNKSVIWKGLGTWQVNDDELISFTPAMNPAYEGLPVRAEKLIRENAAHQVRVGEDHRSSIEMTALLTARRKKVSLDLWLGLAALILLVGFWSLYLFQQPLTPEAIANPSKALEKGYR